MLFVVLHLDLISIQNLTPLTEQLKTSLEIWEKLLA